MRRCEGTETEKEVRTDMNKGRIVQVMGPVVDVLFEDGELPNIKDALEVDNGDKTCIMEVAQHLGNSEVRCLMLAASEGLHKDMEVRATGSGIKVPVGDQTLGRLFNVLGQTIDDGKEKIELVVLLTAFYGLRRSEVIGLKWSAFDFNHNCFSIRHTVTTCNVKGERVTIKKDKAKNKSSLRTYPLIPFLKERLLEAKKQQEENRKLCGRSYNKEYLGYFCVDVMGKLIKPNYVYSTFGKLLAKNNLRHIRFHDLRHTCASLLLANGVPMEQVKEWLGHSEISTTVDIYGHLQYATKKQSAAAIEQDIVAPMLQNLSAVSP